MTNLDLMNPLSALCCHLHVVHWQGLLQALLAQPEADRLQGAVAAVALPPLQLDRRAALLPARQEVLGRLGAGGQVHRPTDKAPLRQRRRV